MKVTGKIEKIMDVQKGISKAGKDWQKVSFTLRTKEEYNNLYCFDVFGEEKVENFLKYNKVDQEVDVDFNVKTNEWKDKYFTSLDAWKIFKAEASETDKLEASFESQKEEAVLADDDNDELPF